MIKLLGAGILLLSLGTVALADNWALLVAGSNTWFNYRHQGFNGSIGTFIIKSDMTVLVSALVPLAADICHAYQILKARGFPENRIVTMMYDDIAQNPENPRLGEIINQPGGPDVYKGVKIDYRGEDVNPENFLHVLKGEKTIMAGIGTGRVVESGENDTVFINFSDHGGVGLLCFPSDNLYADDLESALRDMAKNKKFNKLLVYVEACEAGSMFDNILEENKDILVSTASAKDESSFGCYCDDSEIDTCLGDLYSVVWMQHMDQLVSSDEGTETIFHQYQFTRTWTNQSHVNLYGDYRLGFDAIGSFFGPKSAEATNSVPTKISTDFSPVDSREVPIHTLSQKLARAKTESQRKLAKFQLKDLIQKRKFADKTVARILQIISQGDLLKFEALNKKQVHLTKEDFPCYKNLIKEFNTHCFNSSQNNYLVKHFYKLLNICQSGWATEKMVVKAMKHVCSETHQQITGLH